MIEPCTKYFFRTAHRHGMRIQGNTVNSSEFHTHAWPAELHSTPNAPRTLVPANLVAGSHTFGSSFKILTKVLAGKQQIQHTPQRQFELVYKSSGSDHKSHNPVDHGSLSNTFVFPRARSRIRAIRSFRKYPIGILQPKTTRNQPYCHPSHCRSNSVWR